MSTTPLCGAVGQKEGRAKRDVGLWGGEMKRLWLKTAVLLLLAVGAIAAWHFLPEGALEPGALNHYKRHLLSFARYHYLEAVVFYLMLVVLTALFLPGALVVTVGGGLVFGTVPSALYSDIAGTFGATLAFLAARLIVGAELQKHLERHLKKFNTEMAEHGHNYLLMLRVLPFAPFFIVNYCAGMTKIPLKTFAWTTAVGMLPGALLHGFIGEQLRGVEAVADLASVNVLLPLILISLLALGPVILHHLKRPNSQ